MGKMVEISSNVPSLAVAELDKEHWHSIELCRL